MQEKDLKDLREPRVIRDPVKGIKDEAEVPNVGVQTRTDPVRV
jgi:hypothetical protein